MQSPISANEKPVSLNAKQDRRDAEPVSASEKQVSGDEKRISRNAEPIRAIAKRISVNANPVSTDEKPVSANAEGVTPGAKRANRPDVFAFIYPNHAIPKTATQSPRPPPTTGNTS